MSLESIAEGEKQLMAIVLHAGGGGNVCLADGLARVVGGRSGKRSEGIEVAFLCGILIGEVKGELAKHVA